MEVIVRGKDKLKAIAELFPNIWNGSVLDVGCRDMRLQDFMCSVWDYFTLDIDPLYKPTFCADIASYYPGSFHSVVALDVLEHTDDICSAIKNIFRSAERYILISLPNLYYYKHRLKFLLGKTHSGKYGLPADPNHKADRHRWLFTLSDARDFIDAHARLNKFRVVREICLTGPRFRYLTFLPKLWPTLFARTYVALLERR